MTWVFYRKHLIYVSPYWLLITAILMLSFIDSVPRKMSSPHNQVFFILCEILISIIFWWLITPFTFLFLKSFDSTKELFTVKKLPSIQFEDNTQAFVKVLLTALVFIMHYALEMARYILACGMVTMLSFIISPLVIVAIAMEKLLKKLFTNRI